MPKSKQQIIRFRIIDRELRKWPSIKTERLVQVISNTLMQPVTARTIQKDIQAMRDDVKLGYNAPIIYDRSKGYSYSDRSFSITNYNLAENEIAALKFYAECLNLYSGYSIFQDFSSAVKKIIDGVDIKRRLSNQPKTDLIIQTDNYSLVKGAEFIPIIVDAIVEGNYLFFTYQKYAEAEAKERIFAPYLLKEYKNRWYIIGGLKDHTDISTFALDRISSLQCTSNTFDKPDSFNPDIYFQHSFGIFTLNSEKEEIVLKFDAQEAPYIKSLPIHSTQQILSEDEAGLTISIHIVPSYEFYEYILGKTPRVRIVSPKHIQEKVLTDLNAGRQLY